MPFEFFVEQHEVADYEAEYSNQNARYPVWYFELWCGISEGVMCPLLPLCIQHRVIHRQIIASRRKIEQEFTAADVELVFPNEFVTNLFH